MAETYGMGTLDAKKLLHCSVEQGVWKWPSETVSRAGSTQLSSALLNLWYSSSSPLPVQEGCHSSMHLDCFQTSHRGAEVGFSSVALFFSDSEADLSLEPPGLAAVVLGPDVSMAPHDPGSK